MILARNMPPRLEDAILIALKGMEAPEGSVMAWTQEEVAAYIATVLVEQGNPQLTFTIAHDGKPHKTVALFFRTCECDLSESGGSA